MKKTQALRSIRIPLVAVATRLGLVVASCLACLLLGELALRAVPALLPAGTYFGSGIYDATLGFYVPSSTVIYNKDRYQRRTPNGDGFMDIDHDRQRSPGVTRVGFFGDSYVESVQVPLESVFFRQIPPLTTANIETFGFGISGIGTLQSSLLYRRYAAEYDLDVAIYVFVPNDLGDHFERIQRGRKGTLTPPITADLTTDLASHDQGFEVFAPPPPSELPMRQRWAMQLKARSLLARVVLSRGQLLMLRSDRRLDYGTGATVPAIRDPALLSDAKVLTRTIMAQWQREVQADGRDLIVVYTPQGTRELSGELPYQDTWHPWLARVCDDLGLPLIDPTSALRARLETGDAVYGDHWTPAGHQVMATVLARAIDEHLTGDENRADESSPTGG